MWIPSWLGEVYARLYARFKCELFTFQQARATLSLNENLLSVAFSKLHSVKVLAVFEAGRPRLYRLMDPENFILLASERLMNLEKVSQERYLKLICDLYRVLVDRLKLFSIAVYGSVARGKAREDSDLDLLLVSSDFKGSMGSRMGELCLVEEAVKAEKAWLWSRGVYVNLSFYPLREEELSKLPILLLDLVDEAIILHDEAKVLERALISLKARLLEVGARRVPVGPDRWYWDLKPNYRFGEKVEL